MNKATKITDALLLSTVTLFIAGLSWTQSIGALESEEIKAAKHTVVREQELRKLTTVESQPKEAQASRLDARSSEARNTGP